MHEVKNSGTIFEDAKNCVNLIIQRKIFSESKDEVAIILLGTPDTNHSLDDGEAEYANISITHEFKTANWEMLEDVENIKPGDVSTESMKDSALLVAIHELQKISSNKKFLSRRILFISRFDIPFVSDKIDRICGELKTFKIDLNIIGPTEFPEDEIKNGNYMGKFANVPVPVASANPLRTLLKEVDGEFYSFSEAIPALVYYQKRKVQPTAWNANLDIGTNLTIPISAFTKVMESKPKAWKKVYARKLNAKLERNVTYLMNDEAQTKVAKEDTISAFKYGTTLVPFTEEDKQNMDYQSGERGIKVLGFTKAENVHRYHYIGDKSLYIFGQKNRELAGVILAPFIQALHDTNMVAIVRYVYSPRSAPKIGFLAPKIKPTYECLVFIQLPFMEDLRHFIFTPLDANSSNLPSDDQLSAVGDLITSMDLSTALVDEEGNLEEALKPKNTVNPYLQRLFQCLQFRCLHPAKPLPDIPPHIQAIVNPLPKLVKMAEPAVDKIKQLFPLKECITKKPNEASTNMFSIASDKHEVSETPKENSHKKKKPAEVLAKYENAKKKMKVSNDLSIEDIYPGLENAVGDKIVSVGSVTPVQDFQFLLNSQSLQFGEACKQLIDVVNKFLKESSLKHFHIKILDICKELRHSSLKKNDAAQFNIFMKNLRVELLARDPELWNKIKNEKIGLLSNKEVKFSTVSPSDADDFLTASSMEDVKPANKTSQVYEEEEDDYDLLDQL